MRAFLKSVYVQAYRDDIFTYAAALAFYLALALAPLFMLLIVLLAFLDLDLTSQLFAKIDELIGRDAAQVFSAMANSAKSQEQLSGLSGTVAILALIISSSAIFSQIKTSFSWIFRNWHGDNRSKSLIYEIRDFLKSRIMAVMMIFTFAALIILSLAVAMLISYFGFKNASALKLINILGDLLVFTFLFAVTFKVMSGIRLTFSECLGGAVLTAILFTCGKDLVGLYLRAIAAKSTYGAAGLPFALFIWLYYSSFSIMLGAEVISILKMRKQLSPRVEPPIYLRQQSGISL